MATRRGPNAPTSLPIGMAKIASRLTCVEPMNASVEDGARPSATKASWNTPQE